MKPAGALAVLAAFAALAFGCEAKIGRRWRAYPEPVLNRALEALPNSRVVEVDEKTVDGRRVYEVAVASTKKSMNVLLGEDASVLRVEERLEVYELPPDAFEALDKAYPEGFITEVDLITEGADKRYDIELSLEKGASVDVALGADFALRGVTETIEPSAVPEAAMKAARAAAGGETRLGRVKRTKSPSAGGEKVSYALDLVRDAKRDMMKVHVSADGAVARTVVQPIPPDYLDLGLDRTREK